MISYPTNTSLGLAAEIKARKLAGDGDIPAKLADNSVDLRR